MAVLSGPSDPTKFIRNCSVAVVGNPPTGQSTTDYRPLETVCNESAVHTSGVINTFNSWLDGRFKTQTVILDGGGA